VKADAVIKWFMPREERFHELFERDSANLARGAKVFLEIVESKTLEERRVKSTELKAIEHDGDQITRQIFEAVNSTFITPLDREDIHALAGDLDDILDHLEGVAQHLVLFELRESPEALHQFAEIIADMAVQIEVITRLLWDMANEPQVREANVRISDLENRADTLYNAVIADLFRGNGLDPIVILKWKEVYQGLENACDACKDFTHAIGNIVTKNA